MLHRSQPSRRSRWDINNRDILLNIGTYARTTKCACAYGSVQNPLASQLRVYSNCSAKEYRVPESSCPWFVALLQTVSFFTTAHSTSEKSGQARLWKSVLSRLIRDSWDLRTYVYISSCAALQTLRMRWALFAVRHLEYSRTWRRWKVKTRW